MELFKCKDFLDYAYLSALEMNPRGSHAAFLVHRADMEKNDYSAEPYLLDMKTEQCTPLPANAPVSHFLWLDDETLLCAIKTEEIYETRYIAFCIIEREDTPSNIENEPYCIVPLPVTAIHALDRDRFVLTATYQPESREEREANKDYEILDEIPFWQNDKGFSNRKRNRLYFFHRKGGTLLPITDSLTNVESFSVCENRILYVSNRLQNKYDGTSGLYEYDLTNGSAKTLIAQGSWRIDFAEYLGDAVLCAMTQMKRFGLNENPAFYLKQATHTDFEYLSYIDSNLCSSVGSDCRYGRGTDHKVYNNVLYFVTTRGSSSIIHKYHADGAIETRTAKNGSVDCFDIGPGGLLMIGLRHMHLQEVYRCEEDLTERQLTHFNDAILTSKKVSIPESFEFYNDDTKIKCFVLKPADFDPSEKYPGILTIHGGPKTVYGSVFFHEMQYWASLGYFVFYCNPRGSDGYGSEFADIRGKYGTVDYSDLMAFTDQMLIRYPQLDPNRLGVTGGSYGGYMTNWIIGHTDRFCCAVSQRSISNWASMFGTTDIGYYFTKDQIQATPWNNHQKLWWHSPLKYASRAVTPTLFIHSEQDYRCWLDQGLQMFTALKYNDVEARLCMFRGENHELSRSGKPRHRIKRLEEITGWFEKYLKQ